LLVEHLVDLGDDRGLDLEPIDELFRSLGRRHAFGHADRLEDGVQGLAFAEPITHGKISAFLRRTGQKEVADTT
jgi:hypothetical protein